MAASDIDNCIIEPPLTPVKEEHIWLTNILKAEDNSEQRIKLRKVPQKRFHLKFATDTETSVISFQNILSKTKSIYLPMFHLPIRVTEKYKEKSTKITLDYAITTFITNASNILAVNPITKKYINISFLSYSQGQTINIAPLESDITPDWILYPAVLCYPEKRSSWERYPRGGTLSVDLISDTTSSYWNLSFQDKLNYLNGSATLTKRPIVIGKTNDFWITNYQYVDNPVGRITLFPEEEDDNLKFLYKVSFKIPRNTYISYITEFDFWYEFLNYVGGSNKAFLMPTWEPDFEIQFMGGTDIYVSDHGKAQELLNRYNKGETCYIFVQNPKGEQFWYTVTDIKYSLILLRITLNVGNNPLPAVVNSTGWLVSLVHKVRIDGDTVRFQHYQNHSLVSFNVLEINE